jgi:hypothetical protein
VLVSSARIELIVIAAIAGLTASALGLAISANAKSADKALAVLPMTLVLQLVLAGEWAQDARMPLVRQVRSLVGARWGMEAMVGSLRGDAGQWWTSIVAMVALGGGALVVAALRVAQSTRTAQAPRSFHLALPQMPAMPRLSTRVLVITGTAAAVTMSLAAGGTGVMALARAHRAAPAAIAATVAHSTAAKSEATRNTVVVTPAVSPTPDTTPTTAVPAPAPSATPPVASKPKAKVVSTVEAAIPQPTSVSIPVVSTPEIVTPAPTTSGGGILPSAPVATTSGTKTNPLTLWMKLLNPFAPATSR